MHSQGVSADPSRMVRGERKTYSRDDGAAGDTSTRPQMMEGLYAGFANGKVTLADCAWSQQRLHEWRRWSVVQMLGPIDIANLSPEERIYVWNAGRAELTTKPGADRLTRICDKECRIWSDEDPALAAVMQACGTWSRYWNEEEAHHEVAFNRLAAMTDMPALDDGTFLEYRKVFPDDDMLRTLTLLAISEITAATNYTAAAKVTKDAGLKALFRQVAADEIQHLEYFRSFARALVDSGRYPRKHVLAVALLYLRDGGELYGSTRKHIEDRGTHVNWWDTLDSAELDRLQPVENQTRMIFNLVKHLTDVEVKTVEALEDTWMDMVGQ